MSEHTKTPWQFDCGDIGVAESHRYADIYTLDEEILIASVNDCLTNFHANAAFIVTACNNFDPLVKALENLIEAVKPMEGAPYWQDHEDLVNAKKALAEAKP